MEGGGSEERKKKRKNKKKSRLWGKHRQCGLHAFAAVLPTFVLVSRMQFAQRYRGNATSFSAESSSRLETMVGGVLTRVSVFRVGLGQWGYHRVWIVHSTITFPDFSFVDLILDLSSRPFIPLPRFIRSSRPTPIHTPSLVFFPPCSA